MTHQILKGELSMSDKKAQVTMAKEASIKESVTKVFYLMGGITKMSKHGTT